MITERKWSDGWLAAGLSVLLVCGTASCWKESNEEEAGLGTAAVERIAETEEVQGPQRVVPQVGPIQPRRLSFATAGPPRLAVVEADGTTSVWRLEPPEQPLCFAWIHTDAADAVFGVDGETLITAGRDGAITLWSSDGRLLKQIPDAHGGGVRAVAVSPSGLIASGGADGMVRLWLPEGTPHGEPLAGHAGAVLSVAWSKQGDVASFGIDQTLRIWSPGADGVHRQVQWSSLEVPTLTSRLPHLLAYDPIWGWGRAVAFGPQGDTVAVAPFDGTMRLVRKDGTVAAGPIQGHGGSQSPAVASGGDWLVSAGHDGTLRIWWPDGGPTRRLIPAHDGPAVGVDLSPDGALIASAGTDDAVRLWDGKGKRIAELPKRRKGRIRSMAVSPNGERIAASSPGEARLWSRAATALAPPVESSPTGAATLAFSPRSDLLAGTCRGNYVCVWSMNGQPYGVPHEAFWSEITAIAFTPDGRRLAGGHNYAAPVLVWDAEKDRPHAQLEGLNAETNALAVFPDGATLAAGSIALRFWKLDGSWRSQEINTHGGIVFAIAISPDGNRVASAGLDGRIYLWNPDGSAAGAPLEGHVGRVNALSFTAAGELLSGGEDGKLRIWSIDSRQPRRVVNVGAPILLVGGTGNLTWAGTRRWEVHFYDKDGVSAATLFVEPASAVVTTASGSYSGDGELLQRIQAFDPSAKTVRAARASAGRVEESFAAAVGQGPPQAGDSAP